MVILAELPLPLPPSPSDTREGVVPCAVPHDSTVFGEVVGVRGECVTVLDVADELSKPSTSACISEHIFMVSFVSVCVIFCGAVPGVGCRMWKPDIASKTKT
jgi:hypothetical protein